MNTISSLGFIETNVAKTIKKNGCFTTDLDKVSNFNISS